MTYNVVYIDGPNTLRLEFPSVEEYQTWSVEMDDIKNKAASLNNVPRRELSSALVEWLEKVARAVEGPYVVLPSILTVRDEHVALLRTINNERITFTF
jgi:hypothetical protein